MSARVVLPLAMAAFVVAVVLPPECAAICHKIKYGVEVEFRDKEKIECGWGYNYPKLPVSFKDKFLLDVKGEESCRMEVATAPVPLFVKSSWDASMDAFRFLRNLGTASSRNQDFLAFMRSLTKETGNGYVVDDKDQELQNPRRMFDNIKEVELLNIQFNVGVPFAVYNPCFRKKHGSLDLGDVNTHSSLLGSRKEETAKGAQYLKMFFRKAFYEYTKNQPCDDKMEADPTLSAMGFWYVWYAEIYIYGGDLESRGLSHSKNAHLYLPKVDMKSKAFQQLVAGADKFKLAMEQEVCKLMEFSNCQKQLSKLSAEGMTGHDLKIFNCFTAEQTAVPGIVVELRQTPEALKDAITGKYKNSGRIEKLLQFFKPYMGTWEAFSSLQDNVSKQKEPLE